VVASRPKNRSTASLGPFAGSGGGAGALKLFCSTPFSMGAGGVPVLNSALN
jgi:hypothetical protein